jgi:hypothetical protein
VRLPDGSLLPARRRIVYLFNPDADVHWGNVRFRFTEMQERGEIRRVVRTTEARTLLDGRVIPPGEILHHVIRAESTDNVENLATDYQLRLTEHTGPWYDRYVLGKWGSFEGQVYPNFSESLHVLDDPFPEWGWQDWGGYPPPKWRRARGVDFGFGPGHPFVMGWFAQVPADCPRWPRAWILYREIYMTARLVATHAEVAKRMDAEEVQAWARAVDRFNKDPRNVGSPLRTAPAYLSYSLQVADHDAEDRATLEAAGIYTEPAIKDRLPGAQTFHRALEPVLNPASGAKEPRLGFMRHSVREIDRDLQRTGHPTCTWHEVAGLRWEKPPASADRPRKEDWVKVKDHGTDMTRYVLQTDAERGSMVVTVLNVSPPRDDDD